MAYEDYLKAQKMGLKDFKSATNKGQYPYLPVLDEILSHAEIECEVNLGVMNIPLYQVVGTSTFGRTQAFASNFTHSSGLLIVVWNCPCTSGCVI